VTGDKQKANHLLSYSDTTSTTASTVVFHLARNPALQLKLQSELDSKISWESNEGFYRSIYSLPYLNACITEALRIQPPVAGGNPRLTPPEGLRLPNGTSIPGDSIVSIPILPLQRDPRYYVQPESYIPERWTDEGAAEFTLNKAAFMPFGGGHYICPGRGLAYIELRVMVAKVFSRFDVRLADGEDGKKFLEETKDCHFAHLGDFKVVFTERGKGN
jgi:cytochrome P450